VTVWLLDAGPLVAYLDAGDPEHAEVAACLDAFSGRLATTSAVIAESMHLVARDTRGPRLLADWVSASAVEVYDFSRPPEILQAVVLAPIPAAAGRLRNSRNDCNFTVLP
jgi:predicted nucleic acid-binding protein